MPSDVRKTRHRDVTKQGIMWPATTPCTLRSILLSLLPYSRVYPGAALLFSRKVEIAVQKKPRMGLIFLILFC